MYDAGPFGVGVAVLSIGWSFLRVIKGVQLYNSGKHVKEKTKCSEERLQMLHAYYKELCDKDYKVKSKFSVCEDYSWHHAKEK